MDLVCKGLDARESLALLDEPDLGLSPRSCRRLWDAVSGLVYGKGCQVVMACHSPVVFELAGEVLDMESRRWTGWREFMGTFWSSMPLRWVDGKGTELMDLAVRMVVEYAGSGCCRMVCRLRHVRQALVGGAVQLVGGRCHEVQEEGEGGGQGVLALRQEVQGKGRRSRLHLGRSRLDREDVLIYRGCPVYPRVS